MTCPTQRSRPGVRTTRCRKLDHRDRTKFLRIPITTIPRALADVAARLDEDDLARAVHEAEVKYRTTPVHVEATLKRRPNARGSKKLRRVLHGEVRVALSKLERRFIELLRREGIPLPQTNCPASGRRVDCRWPQQRLPVELDSYTYHSSRHAWERDRRREREAHARGDEFRRFTYGDVFERPDSTLRELRLLLMPALFEAS